MKKIINILPKPHNWLVGAVILYLLSFLFVRTFSPINSLNTEINQLEKYIHSEEKEFAKLVADSLLIAKLANKTQSTKDLKEVVAKATEIFIYKKNIAETRLTFWSSQNIYPPDDVFRLHDTLYFKSMERGNGYYLCTKRTLPSKNESDSLIVIGMIPIMYHYFSNLPDKFEYSSSANILISGLPTDHPVKSLSGNTLFYVTSKNQIDKPTENIAIYLKLIAVLLLLIYIHFMAEKTAREYGFWKGLFFLAVILFILRLVSYYTHFPVNFRQFELFNPNVYGSNPIHKSLGDLLINTILFCWIILFSSQRLDKTGFYNVPSGKKGFVVGGIASLIVVVITFLVAYIIRSLAADSSISFDVINFFSLTPYTFFGFVTLSILAVAYYYFMRIMIPLLLVAFKGNFYPV